MLFGTTKLTLSVMKTPPFSFVLEELGDARVNPMFGAFAVYLGERIVFILRERDASPRDNGVWIATSVEHHESLRKQFPSLRSIELFERKGPTGWQVLPADADDFEESVLRACALALAGDPRIGKVPAKKRARAKAARPFGKTTKASAKLSSRSTKRAARKVAKKRRPW